MTTTRTGAPDPSDAELLRQHVDGDPHAFDTLVRRHTDRLWAVALRTMRDPEDAADALQDALINAFRRAGSFRGDAQVTSWLHRILVNACLDRIRRRTARPGDATDFTSGEQPAHTRADQPMTSVPQDPADTVSLRADLQRALATLPDDQRVPLVLVDVEGYPVAEVAAMLDLPVGTVKSRCARARARLLPLLRDTPADPSSQPGPGHRGAPNDAVGNREGPGHVPPAGTRAAPDTPTGSDPPAEPPDTRGGS